MAHETKALWSYARGELSRDDAARVAAHLSGCVDCSMVFEQMKAAQTVLAPPQVPQLSAMAWQRVNARVMEAAEKELARPRRFAWLSIPGQAWVGAALVAAAMLLVVFWPRPPAPPVAPVAKLETAAPVVPAPVPAPAAQPKAVPAVRIASAKHAHAGGTDLVARAVVPEGSSLATEKHGELWFHLPDGSRAGLLGEAALRLERVSAQDVKLHVDKGTLLVAAAHRSDRPFAVQAGDVEVHVVGTRFLVARDDAGVDVAVEEGAVQAGVGGRMQRVAAGHSVRFQNGSAKSAGLSSAERGELSRLEPVGPPAPIEEQTPEIPATPAPNAAEVAGPPAVAAPPAAPKAPAPLPDSGDTDWAAPPPGIGVPTKPKVPWPPIREAR